MEKQAILNHFSGDFKPFYSKYLKQIRSTGNGQLQALCSFHDDKNPSLSIDIATGQYFCHGCGKKGDFIHFYGKINGLDTRRDFGKILNGIADDFGIQAVEKPKPKMVKAYNYTDADNKLIFQVCRMDPKNFLQRQPNGKG
jgi:DNA primase